MNKIETIKLLKKISGTYPNQFFVTEDVENAWSELLEPYDYVDLEKRLDEYIKSDYDKPPQLPTLIRHLETLEDKRTKGTDCIIYCDLCGKAMSFNNYKNNHRDKCLLIQSLIPILKKQGQEVTYKQLDEYDYGTLDKIFLKYVPIKKNFKIGG